MKLTSKSEELKSALANGVVPYSADVDFFFFEIEVVDFSIGSGFPFSPHFYTIEWFIGPGIPHKELSSA